MSMSEKTEEKKEKKNRDDNMTLYPHQHQQTYKIFLMLYLRSCHRTGICDGGQGRGYEIFAATKKEEVEVGQC